MNSHPFRQLRAALLGQSQAMRRVRSLIARVAPSGLPLLVQGETGTGKELVADAVHALSGRPGGHIKVNVCAIPEHLFESVIMGHAKGAFSGAIRDKPGLLDLSHNGTLLLDEISGLPTPPQAKLLRAIETKEYARVGEESLVRRSDFRLVSASNVPLDTLVALGAFRADLLYRLRTIEIVLPPLRDRREDIPELVQYFSRLPRADRLASTAVFSSRALDLVQAYHWPGNVRELRALVDSTITLSKDLVVDEEMVKWWLRERESAVSLATDVDVNRLHLVEQLEKAGGKVKAVAELHGVHPATVYRWMDHHRIPVPRKSSVFVRRHNGREQSENTR